MTETALSTVALTTYNYLACSRQPCPISDMETDPRIHGQHECTREEIRAALQVMALNGWIVIEDDTARVVDPLSRVCTVRDRKDVEVLPTGEVLGGWTGWQLQNKVGRTPIEEVIR